MIDGTTKNMVGAAKVFFDLGKTLWRDADTDARSRARGWPRADARQVKSDDVLAGEDVRLARAAVRIAPERLKTQTEDAGVERLVERQVAHWNRYMIDGLDAVTNLRDHCVPPTEKKIRPRQSTKYCAGTSTD